MTKLKRREVSGEQTAFAVTRPTTETLVDVFASPDEVFITMPRVEQYLTAEQARELAGNLIAAADLSERLEFSDSDLPDGMPRMFLYPSAADRPE